MKIAPNYRITNIRVNPAGETIEALEINGEAVEMGSAKLENNKAATIDVSTYTEPVEVTPSSGKVAMEKVTVTLSNIPSGGYNSMYSWRNPSDDALMFTFTNTPTTSDKAYSDNQRLTSNGFTGLAITEVGTDELGDDYIVVNSTTFIRDDIYDISQLWH